MSARCYPTYSDRNAYGVLEAGTFQPSCKAIRGETVMTETLKGACLCGRVEYEVQDPESLGYCHCTRCQRWTGSSLAGVVVAKENFRIAEGENLVKRYESEFAPRNFCSDCGSSLYDDLGEKYFVAAGLMRELTLTPSFHLQVAYKADWHEIGGDAPQFAENPPA
ncbi:MAG TPA: GFA family protein [Galbitalea sp.]|nr:GFA family protein [Galbitalea sp.]